MSKGPAEKGRELFEKEEAADRETAKKFDPKKLAKDAAKMKTVYDPKIGEVHYYSLRLDEMSEINKATNDEERNYFTLHKMLSKAYPELTLEDVKAFPLFKAARIIALISEAEGFFYPQTMSKPGSK